MRQIILDTETTGLDPNQGHRIIEVAAVEMINRRLTGNHLHRYVNPERDIDAGAMQVHGITPEFLQDKPRFADVAQEIVDFIQGAELIIHNAPFDVGFLNMEFRLLGMSPLANWCDGLEKCCSLAALDFIHRFLQHVLPHHFVKVRYYGFFAPTPRARLAVLRQSLPLTSASLIPPADQAAPSPGSAPAHPHSFLCPHCGQPMLFQHSLAPILCHSP